MIKIIVTGAKGRMGSHIISLISESSDLELAAGIDIGDSLADVIDGADVIIDFSTPDASVLYAELSATHKKAIVIGTTGLDDVQETQIKKAASSTAVLHAPNMSIGVNVMFKLIKEAAAALDDSYTIRIEETHHIHKKDKPSGTAKRMCDMVPNSNRITEVNSHREGEVVGDHEITFSGHDEILRISHHAESRKIFARGAITAARWIAGKPAGFYNMNDVLSKN
ncbi:MAG: 4-hydroxy-tetrahydrodipicolinate reductase [Deltaproteobacteria bacterium]|jgi:4-hydroxy-tetrahydrodipicolinate reductase|nr:4-hydroxy-tetrahydrodipicolinate reductase [Deltaproteobacteria bacterium]